MSKTAKFMMLFLGSIISLDTTAQPDRESLIEAWESYVASLPGTTSIEATGDGTYRLQDTDLPYDGELRLVGALVRPAESSTIETEFTYLGMVDFELVELPIERMSSQSYYYWVTDRQSLHYSDVEQRWVDPTAYRMSIANQYRGGGSFGVLSFMLNYGVWALLIPLLVFVFYAVYRQAKKARSLMDETAAINRQARENIDRAAGLQDEVLAISRETRDLQSESNELLKKMLDALNR